MSNMKLKIEQVIRVANGIGELDGFDKVVKVKSGDEGSSGDKIVHMSFEGLTSTFRMAMARNLTRCKEVIEDYNRVRNGIIAEMSDGGTEVPKGRISEFIVKERELLDAEIEINLVKVKPSSLKLDLNKIPIAAISNLDPILLDEEEGEGDE